MKKITLYWLCASAIIILCAQLSQITDNQFLNWNNTANNFGFLMIINSILPIILYIAISIFSIKTIIYHILNKNTYPTAALIILIIISAAMSVMPILQNSGIMPVNTDIAIFNYKFNSYAYMFVFMTVNFIYIIINNIKDNKK